MLVLVSYDVATSDKAGRKRLRRVAKTCKNYGQRVQYSVFECMVDPAQWTALRRQLLAEIDPQEDSLRFYFTVPIGNGASNTLEPRKIMTRKGL